MHRSTTLLAAVAWVAVAATAHAQAKKSADMVKITAKAAKTTTGKQVVTVTLAIAPGWHTYANPVGNKDMESSQTTLVLTSGGKPVAAKIEYPAGKKKESKAVGDYFIYEGTITIKAIVDDPGPVDAAVKIQTCNENTCLFPSTVKLKVE